MKLTPKAQKAIDSIIEKFKTGDLGPITQIALIRLSEDAPAAKWTFANRALAYFQSGEVDCRGYRQWQHIGRHVSRGSQAAYILIPLLVTKETENDQGEKEQRQACVGFRPIPVFASNDTEGDEPLPDYKPAEYPPLFAVARRLNVEVDYLPTPLPQLGAYRPTAGTIVLGAHNHDVFFHELAHAAHDQVDPDFRKRSKEEVEVIAEFTAAVLMSLYGYDHSKSAWSYISAFSQDPIKAIMKALNTIGDVLALILEDEAEESEIEPYQRLAVVAA